MKICNNLYLKRILREVDALKKSDFVNIIHFLTRLNLLYHRLDPK